MGALYWLEPWWALATGGPSTEKSAAPNIPAWAGGRLRGHLPFERGFAFADDGLWTLGQGGETFLEMKI